MLVLVGQLLWRNVRVVGGVGVFAFGVGVVILWIWLIVQAFQGREHKLPYIGDFAERQLK